jgi:hypothetical protein
MTRRWSTPPTDSFQNIVLNRTLHEEIDALHRMTMGSRQNPRMALNTHYFVLSANCPHCGGPLRIECEATTGHTPMQWHPYECPHCHEPDDFSLEGQVLRVAARSYARETAH